jgi:CheY-like chemotaxis protein
MMPATNEKPGVKGSFKGSLKKENKSRILIIEDNADSQFTLKVLLEEHFNLSFAADGPSGLLKAKTLLPDLILLDISLPGMDGLKVLDEFRKDDQLAQIKTIALTARAMKGDRETLLNYGFDGYIAKPVDDDTFENTINEYLKSGKSTRVTED